MTDAPENQIEGGLKVLEELATKSLAPDRIDLRRVLVPLGELLLAGEEERARPLLERLESVGRRAGEPFSMVLESELALACAEHVHSVDRRYLSLPNYDLEYTLAARERLRARVAVAAALGFRLPNALLRQVDRADEILQRYVQQKGR